MNIHKYILTALCIPILAALLGGCQQSQEQAKIPDTSGGVPDDFLREQWQPEEVPVAHIVRRDYRLREGDLLEIIYHVRHERDLSYKIKLQDVIEIRFPFHPALHQVEQVQSDGTLHLDLVGEVYVFDRTIDDVHEELVKRYSKFLKNPVLTASFKESNVKIAELKEAIKTAPRGQSRLVPITPDGTISLPFVVDVPAAGLTVGQLHKELNKAYREVGLDQLEVTVNVQTVAPVRIYVLGEVRIPGALLNKTGGITTEYEVTLLQAIAQAGSYIPGRADLSKVMLIRRRHRPKPEAAIINVRQLLYNRSKAEDEPVVADMSKHRYDIWLEDGDIIYVPTTKVARRADYIEYVWTRGIRAVGGFSSSAGYSAADAVDWLGPNP